MSDLEIAEIKSHVARVARLYDDIEKVSLFGSYANGKQKRKSDIDLLVKFGEKATYLTVFDFQHKIKSEIGKKVDIVPLPIPADSILKMGNIGKEILLYARA